MSQKKVVVDVNDCIRRDYVRREEPPVYCSRPEDAFERQKSVYELASKVKCERVVDIGCGTGEKLIYFFKDRITCGVDYGENLRHCFQQYPDKCWVNADLNVQVPVAVDSRTLVICADVIEHLQQLAPIMEFMAKANQTAKAVVVSTPDRHLVRGDGDTGPPKSKYHVREWTTFEFNKLLRKWGINSMFSIHGTTTLALFGETWRCKNE